MTGIEAYHNASYVVGLSGITVVEVAAYWDHACALSDIGEVYCWGRNSLGQLGIGNNVDSTTPVQVSLPSGVVVASLGQGPTSTTCVISTDGDGYWSRGLGDVYKRQALSVGAGQTTAKQEAV